jgi:lipoyl(octanoyl) transferase
MTDADRSPAELWVCHLGIVGYRDALAIQERIRARRQARELPDTLLLLEHPPVYTRGRRSGAEDLPYGEDFYRAKGIDVLDTDRGGRLTYHGPGQLVGYPIMAIHDVGRFLRTIEGAIIAALAEEGVHARSRHREGIDYTGVWVAAPRGTPPLGAHPEGRTLKGAGRQADERKIASIGVHVSRGVTTHGFAVNVHNDLEPFSWVLACGLPDVRMTSLADELRALPARPRVNRGTGERPGSAADGQGAAVNGPGAAFERFRLLIAHSFCRAHGRAQRTVPPTRLGIDHADNPGLAEERAPIKSTPRPSSSPASVPAVPV